MDVLPKLRGAFSLVFMDEHTLYAARDPQGVRPLVLGRLERGWVVTSETAALDIVGASFVREIEPGELVAIDEDGLRSAALRQRRAEGLPVRVRLPRPSRHHDRRTQRALRPGRDRPPARQASTRPTPTWSSRSPSRARPAAIGYAEASGIPYGIGLVKNAYVGRTFIQPSQTIRQLGIRLKLNPLRDVIRGKRLVVVDDSIVRGNTQRALVRMLREAGAVEVHVRISSPPVKWPCFYGIDFGTNAELIANSLDTEGIRPRSAPTRSATSPSTGTSPRATSPYNRLCCACFDGRYPIALPDIVGKHVLEGIEQVGVDDRRPRTRTRAGLQRRGRAHPPVSGPSATTRHLRRRRRRHRGGRARRRADEGRGQAHRPRPEVLGGLGGFAGLFSLDLASYPQPVLASSTDGVGTKIAIAQALDRHDTIGIDLVAMVVDDLVVVGAEPLFLSDYIATGKVVPERIAAIVAGHRRGLRAGRLRARRRRDRRAPRPDGARTSTTCPAPASASSTPTRCSAPTASGPATS